MKVILVHGFYRDKKIFLNEKGFGELGLRMFGTNAAIDLSGV